jgi:hypothetical protein
VGTAEFCFFFYSLKDNFYIQLIFYVTQYLDLNRIIFYLNKAGGLSMLEDYFSMAALFAVFLIAMGAVWAKLNNTAIVIVIINLIICTLMLYYHMDTIVDIRL